MRLPWSGGSSVHFAIHPWTLMVWIVFWLLDYGFSPLEPILYSFRNLVAIPAIPLCYSCYGVTWPVLAGPPLGLLHVLLSIGFNDPVWSLDLYSCYFGLSWPITLFVGPFGLFLSPWASSAHFLILYSHEFLLTLLGFLGPITLSFILGAHGLFINLFLTSLLWAYHGPFLLFYIT